MRNYIRYGSNKKLSIGSDKTQFKQKEHMFDKHVATNKIWKDKK